MPEPGEIPGLRTQTSRTYRLGSGGYRVDAYAGPINYKDAGGNWQPIDDTLVPSSKPGYAYENKADEYKLYVPDDLSAGPIRMEIGDRWVTFSLTGAKGRVQVTGNTATFPDVLPGVTLAYAATPEGVKETLKLADPAAAKAFSFQVATSPGLTPQSVPGGGFDFLDAQAKTAFSFPAPFMVDSSQKDSGFSSDISFDLSRVQDSLVLSVVPNLAWLLDPARKWPVVIDPSIIRNPSIDCHMSNDQANTSFCSLATLRFGYTGAWKRRMLLKFDLSSIPSTATVNEADLALYMTGASSSAWAWYEVHKVTRSWTAGATWNKYDGSNPSATPGGDFTSFVQYQLHLNGAVLNRWKHWYPTSLVQQWVQGTYPNYGLLIKQDTETVNNVLEFPSKDSSNATYWPSLRVVYDNQAPSTPTLDSPAPGAAVPTITPVLKATATDPEGEGPDYSFQVATDSGFNTIVASSGGFLPGTNTFTVPPGALKDGSTYWWRAQAKDRFGAQSAWSAGQSINVRLLKLGSREGWPMWSHGPLSVNQANGNLVVSLPGPSYPTAAGSMGAALSFNSMDPVDHGFGPGWVLDAGETLSSPPEKLIDHSLLTGSAKFDAVEMVFPGGDSAFYTHVGTSLSYLAPPGDGSQLKKDQTGTWTLVDEDGAIYSFGVADPSTGVATLTGAEIADASPGAGKLTYAFSGNPPKISTITDTANRSLGFNWACSNAVLCVTGPDGVIWRFVGDGPGGTTGKLFKVNDGTRDLVSVSYDGSNRINKVQNANDLDPTHASPGYNGTHALTIGYDGSNRVTSVTDGPVTGQAPANSTWTLAYTVNPGLIDTTATRAAHGSLPAGSVRKADGYTTLTPPNQQGQQTPKFTKVFFDNLGQVMETDDVFGTVSEVSYDSSGRELWSEDEDGNPTENAWDTVNNVLLSVTGPDPDGTGGPLVRPVTTYRYDETKIGSSSSPGPALQGLQASYYDTKNLVSATLGGRPVARQTDTSVDFNWGLGNPPVLGNHPDDFSIRWTGNLVVTSDGDYTLSVHADDGTRLTVDGIHAIESWTDGTAARTVSSSPIHLTAGLHPIVLEYKDSTSSAEVHLQWACGNCTPLIDEQVIPSSALQPAWMNRTSVSPSGKVSFHHFADPAAGHPDYDLRQLSDGTNVITAYSYDTTGRMTQKVLPKGNASRIIDAGGNLTGTPDLTFATTWTYYGLTETASIPAACGGGTSPSQAGLLKSLQHAGLTAETTVYDSAGRAIAVTNGGGSTCNTYDAQGEGRLTSDKAPGESQATTYAYDPAGATRTSTDPNGTVTIEYDEAGRAKRTVDSLGAEATFAFDADGNLLTRVAAKGALGSNPNYTTNYFYDAADQLTSLTDPAGRAWSFYYDTRGNLHATQYPNGTFSWSDFNAAGWLMAVYNRHGTLSPPLPGTAPADSLGSPIADYAYLYNIDGKKTSETRTGGGLPTQTTTYDVYDSLDRLSQVTLPNGTVRVYAFDLDSNRTTVTETPPGGNPVVVATYTYNPAQTPGLDELTTVTTGTQTTFTYNSDGQTTAKGTSTITWDGRGRTTGGTFSGTTVSYVFDATGRRRQRNGGGTVTRYLFAGSGEAPLFLTDGAATITETDVDGPAGDLGHYTGAPTGTTQLAYLYYAGHGDLAATADNSGTRTAAYTYDPFGTALEAPPANTTTERWTGRWDKQLDTTGLFIQMGARPYDPSLGRFLAVDPVEGGSLTNYDYAGHDPVNVYDLTGECWWGISCWRRKISRSWHDSQTLCLGGKPLFGLGYHRCLSFRSEVRGYWNAGRAWGARRLNWVTNTGRSLLQHGITLIRHSACYLSGGRYCYL